MSESSVVESSNTEGMSSNNSGEADNGSNADSGKLKVSSKEAIDNEGSTKEVGGPKGLEPTRYGDWESKGRCYDF